MSMSVVVSYSLYVTIYMPSFLSSIRTNTRTLSPFLALNLMSKGFSPTECVILEIKKYFTYLTHLFREQHDRNKYNRGLVIVVYKFSLKRLRLQGVLPPAVKTVWHVTTCRYITPAKADSSGHP